MILLVVPRGFSTGTELLNTRAHSSQMDFPMVKVEPPGPVGGQDRAWTSPPLHPSYLALPKGDCHKFCVGPAKGGHSRLPVARLRL